MRRSDTVVGHWTPTMSFVKSARPPPPLAPAAVQMIDAGGKIGPYQLGRVRIGNRARCICRWWYVESSKPVSFGDPNA